MAGVSALSSLAAAQRHARDLQRAGDLGSARAMLEQTVRQGQASLGPDDPAVLAAVHQLATVHRAAGDALGARRILEEALPGGQRRLGFADPLILGISFDLGRIAEDLENRHEARRAYGQVAAYGPNVLGEDHWAVVQARAYLGEDSPTVRLTMPEGGVEQLRRVAEGSWPAARQDGVQVPQQRTGSTVPQQSPATPLAQAVTGASGAGPRTGTPGTRGAPRQDGTGPGAGSRPIPLSGPGIAFPPNGARRRRRPAAVAGATGAVVVVLALLVWLAVKFLNPDGEGLAPVSGGPPTDVRLSDDGPDVQVSWADPVDGSVPFVVSAGRLGQPLTIRGETRPGRRTFLVQYLDPAADYCFTVGARYSNSSTATSPEVCTNRAAANPRATR